MKEKKEKIVSQRESDKLLGEYLDSLEKQHFNLESKKIVELAKAHLGDLVLYGDLIWKVISIEKEHMLLLSNRVFNCEDYTSVSEENIDYSRPHEKIEIFGKTEICQDEYRWRETEVRQFLNNEFLQKHFTEKEIDNIVSFDIPYELKDGSIVYNNDKVFILSKEELLTYIPKASDRIATFYMPITDNLVKREYFLRLDNENDYYPYVVDTDGIISLLVKGCVVGWCVPAIRIKK